MDFFEDYPKLEPAQKDHFQSVVTRLLSGAVLTPGSPLKVDPDWRFSERYRELIDSYLRLGGWRFDIDLGLRLARAVHEAGSQRVRFTKLESLVLCALRLYYHEQMRVATDRERCDISAGEIRERLIQAGKPASQLSPRQLAHALRRLARHSLVRIDRGFEGQDHERAVVDALVEKVLPPDKIHEIEQKIRNYASRQPQDLAPGASVLASLQFDEEDPAE
jgi:uncharacterized protein DUF4194